MPFQEKTLTSKLEVAHLLGSFIRHHREQENMSLSFMADIVKISKSYLSEIEHGKRIPQSYTLLQIFKVLDISFNDDYDIYIQLKNQLYQLYESYSNLDKDDENTYYERLLANGIYLKYSYGFLQYYLIKLMYEIRLNNSDKDHIERYKLILSKNIDFLSTEEKSIYFDLLALNEIKFENYTMALKYLERGSEVSTSLTAPMINYHLCIVHQSLNNSPIALSYCLKAVDLFSRKFSFKRILYLVIYEANCYSRLQCYAKAELLYQTVLEKTNTTDMENLKITVLNNLAWNALKEGNYKKCIEFTNKAIAVNSNFIDIYMYIPLSYYYLYDYILCLKNIELYENRFLDNSYHNFIMDALKLLVKNDYTRALNLLKECITLCKEYEMKIFIIKLICTILKNLEEHKSLSYYQGILLEYMGM